MNFINFNNHPYSPVLSALGVNVNNLRKPKHNNRKGMQIINVDEVVLRIKEVRAGVVDCNIKSLEIICSKGIFKKETLLKGIYPYRSNICELKLDEIVRGNYNKRIALVERLDFILHAFGVIAQAHNNKGN